MNHGMKLIGHLKGKADTQGLMYHWASQTERWSFFARGLAVQ